MHLPVDLDRLLKFAGGFARLAMYKLAPTERGVHGWLAAELEGVDPGNVLVEAVRKEAASPGTFTPIRRFRKMLEAALKDAMRAKRYEGARAIRRVLGLVGRAEAGGPEAVMDLSRLGEDIALAPRREQSAHAGTLYHGTNAVDAYSILKNGVVLASPLYGRMSLSADPTLAAKFGGVVLGFNGKKLQRRGAKKMNYLGREEMERDRERSSGRVRGADLEADPRNPRMGETLRFEQEWVIRVPFEIGDTLTEVLLFRWRRGGDEKKVREALESVADVPVRTVRPPSHSLFHPDSLGPEGLRWKDPTSLAVGLGARLWPRYLQQEEAVRAGLKQQRSPQGYAHLRLLQDATRRVAGTAPRSNQPGFESYLYDMGELEALRADLLDGESAEQLRPVLDVVGEIVAEGQKVRAAVDQVKKENDLEGGADVWGPVAPPP